MVRKLEVFVPIFQAASRLGVPTPWLIAEVKEGRLPSLRVGKRWLVNLEMLEEALLKRARESNGEPKKEKSSVHITMCMEPGCGKETPGRCSRCLMPYCENHTQLLKEENAAFCRRCCKETNL